MNKISNVGMLAVLFAAAAVSCTKDNLSVNADIQGSRLTFTGNTVIDTRFSIGEKDGEVYPLLWQEGDAIAIWSQNAAPGEPDDSGVPTMSGNILGEQAQLWSGSAGKTSGVFQTNNPVSVTSDEDIVIVYPASAAYSEGVISANVPEFQEQRGSNSSLHVGKYAIAYDKISLKANQTEDVVFHLQQKTAFVKLVLTTSEYASMKLVGASITCPGEVLAGQVTANVADGTLTTVEGKTFDRAGVKYRTPVTFSSRQELYFTALPADLSGKDCVITVVMTDDTKTVTIPVVVKGGKLEASKLSVITVENVSKASVNCAWYEPEETRDLLDAWAYGPQNTYFIEQKAKGEGDTKLTISVKARGDFSKVREPKYYGLLSGSSEMSTRKLIKMPDGTTTYQADPTTPVNPDYTIDLYSFDQSQNGRWATVALYDANKKIIWSFMIWRYLAGDKPSDVAYPGTDIVLMDRILGAPYSNKMALEKGNYDGAPGAFFQWGRKDPFMWSNSGITAVYNEKTTTPTAGIVEAIESPGIIFENCAESYSDWQGKEHRTDLWGGVNNTQDWYDPAGIGHKTIYDPCPEGYRVPDARVFQEVGSKAQPWEVDLKLAFQPQENIKADSPFKASNTAVLAYPLSDTEFDFWPYGGAHWCDNGKGWGNRTSSNTRHACLYWANSVDPAHTNAGIMMEYCYLSSSYNANTRHNAIRVRAFGVRCQKESAK